MVQAGLLRHYLSLYFKAGTKVTKLSKVEHRTKATLGRSSRLRSGAGSYLSEGKWDARVRYFTSDADNKDTNTTSSSSNSNSNGGGYLQEEIQWIDEETERQEQLRKSKAASGQATDSDDGDNPMDPMAMMGPMKGQFAFMAQNMVLMQGIGYFFSGYVLVKVPIPLTNGFKGMFQRGLDLGMVTLETSYVSSVSWYFLVMFGLRAFFKLVIESEGSGSGSGMSMQEEHKRAGAVQTDLGNGFGAGGAQAKKFDGKKFLMGEIESLELMRYNSVLDDADTRLLGKSKRSSVSSMNKKLGLNSDGQPGYDIFGAAAVSSSTSASKGKKNKAKAN